jgi:uncharacterized membrane protein
MPPLGAVGLGLSLGDAQVAGGAFLLFVTNIASISLAGAIVFTLLGIRPETWRPETRQQIWRRLTGFLLLLLVIAIPLAVIMGGVVRDTAARQSIHEVLEVQVASQGGELTEFEFRTEGGDVAVVATIRSVHPLEQATVDTWATALGERLGRLVQLEVIVMPAIRSAPPATP